MMKISYSFSLIILIMFFQCSDPNGQKDKENSGSAYDYFDFSKRDDQFTGGVKMLPINTPKGTFKVWTKRVGNNPDMKVLLLHGGPGGTHEIFECFDGYFPKEGIEYIYYDQLDSYYSDQPNDTSLWTIERFADEVEQVRKALKLDSSNFYLLGVSWGGVLAIEYALRYQNNLKGLIISNMMSSIPEYNKYAQEVLGPQMDPKILEEILALEANKDFENPRYMELLLTNYYTKHLLRMPVEEWPEVILRTFNHQNQNIYIYMQGHSEFGVSGDATLKYWDRSSDLPKITVPSLMIGGKYDTMDPKHMEEMSKKVQNGRYLYCPNGSHSSLYDDQKVYFTGLVKFIKDVDEADF